MTDRREGPDQHEEDLCKGVPHFRRRQQRGRIVVGAVVGAVLLGGIAGLVLWGDDGPPTESVTAANEGSNDAARPLTDTVRDLDDQATTSERGTPEGVEYRRLTGTVADLLDELGGWAS